MQQLRRLARLVWGWKVEILLVLLLLGVVWLFSVSVLKPGMTSRPVTPQSPTVQPSVMMKEGAVWTIVDGRGYSHACTWKKGTTNPKCEGLIDFQWNGSLGYEYRLPATAAEPQGLLVWVLKFREGLPKRGDIYMVNGSAFGL